MLIDELRRIRAFANVDLSELRSLTHHCHVLCLPPARWLVQPGRSVSGYFYLLKGRLQTFAPDRRLRQSNGGAVDAFYPGCAGARTLTHSQVLHIDKERQDFLLHKHSGAGGFRTENHAWLRRFLDSHMMRGVGRDEWQTLLTGCQPADFAAGQAVLRRRQLGRCCFVLESGHAVVHRGPKTLDYLAPGDFFGEDALLSGSGRNADVTALEDVRVYGIDREVFDRVLVANLIQFVRYRSGGVLLNVGERSMTGATPVSLECLREHVKHFDLKAEYFVAGGSMSARVMCAFILIQHGLPAHPVIGADEI